MKMIIQIACRNIWRNPMRSIVIILSVALGLWAGAFVSALYWGVSEGRVRMAIENEVSHIQIHHPEFKNDYKASFYFPEDSAIRNILKKEKNIKAFSFRSVAQGMLTTPGSSTGVNFNGILEGDNQIFPDRQVGRLGQDVQLVADDFVEHLLVQHARDLVDRIGVEALNDGFRHHVAEQRNLAAFFFGH